MSLTIYRYTIPIDDRWHPLRIIGEVLHVGRPPGVDSYAADAVELWAFTGQDEHPERHFRVYGTGHPIDDPCRHVGTAFTAGGRLVWHLMELHPAASHHAP